MAGVQECCQYAEWDEVKGRPRVDHIGPCGPWQAAWIIF